MAGRDPSINPAVLAALRKRPPAGAWVTGEVIVREEWGVFVRLEGYQVAAFLDAESCGANGRRALPALGATVRAKVLSAGPGLPRLRLR